MPFYHSLHFLPLKEEKENYFKIYFTNSRVSPSDPFNPAKPSAEPFSLNNSASLTLYIIFTVT